MKQYIIIGATSSIAEHCMRLWQTNEAIAFTLVGRNQEKLNRIAQDLQVRQPKTCIQIHIVDFKDPQAIESLVETIYLNTTPDLVFIAQGWLGEQRQCQESLTYCKEMLEINAISPLLFAEAFAKNMSKANKGHLVLIGSVGGERGRKSTYIYGAAKSCMAHYAQGLQHRFAHSAVHVTLVKPGPTQTPMIANLQLSTNPASVQTVAKQIMEGVRKNKRVIYTPGRWRWIMWIIRHIPAVIFERLEL